MNHEHEKDRVRSRAAATTHDDTIEPGRSSRSALLDRPAHPVASGLVQRRASATGEADPSAVHAAAARGVATASSRLPYLDTIQRAFGRHDISSVQAHTGPDAAASARAMAAQAYATGDHVVLGGGADLHTVAHEAAHVVQQRGGVQLKGGVDEGRNDPYEQHADAVASAVVRGESAEALLTAGIGGSARLSSPVAVQRRITDAGASSGGGETWNRTRAIAYLADKSEDPFVASATDALAAAIDTGRRFLPVLEGRIRKLVHATLIEETIVAGNDVSDHDFGRISNTTHETLKRLAKQLGAIQKNFSAEIDQGDASLQGTFSSKSQYASWYEPWGNLATGRVKALTMRDEDAETAQEIRSLIHFTTSLSSDAEPEAQEMQQIVIDIAGVLRGRNHYSADLASAVRSRFVKEPNMSDGGVLEDLNAQAQDELNGDGARDVPPLNVKLDDNLYSIIVSAVARTGLPEGPLLKAIATQDGDTLTRLAYVLRFIPKEILRREFQDLLTRPADLQAVNEKLFRLVNININAGGHVHALSAPVAREMLFAAEVDPDRTAAWGPTGTQLPEPEGSETPSEELPEHLSGLIGSGEPTALGRTVVLGHPDKADHSYAVKLLKAQESTLEFKRELQMQGFLQGDSVPGLLSLIPTPVGLYRITQEQWVSLNQIVMAKLEEAQAAAAERGEPPVPELRLEEGEHKVNVMVYEAHNSYFRYQHGGGLQKGAVPDLRKSREVFFQDAMTLLRYGIAFPQLIDLNHNAERVYNWMIDIMRVYYGIQGMGKISNWKGAARYPNIRASGLADLGDMKLLSTMEYDSGKEDVNENESAVGKVWTKMGPQKDKMLIAQYLGNYLLSAILTEAHRFFVTDAERVPRVRETVKEKLVDVLEHTFRTAMQAFSKVFEGRPLPLELITCEELDVLAEQMLYFLGGEYIADARDALLEPEQDDPEGRRKEPKASNAFDARLQQLFPGVDVPPVQELSEQLPAGGYGRQVLGKNGIYSVDIGEDGPDDVTPELVASHPEEMRQVDLGFLNGPQPLAELQRILYKLVGYAIMSISGDGPVQG